MEEKKYKYVQDQQISFDLGDGVHKGEGWVCGVFGPIIIVRLATPFDNYPFTHIYVVDNQIKQP